MKLEIVNGVLKKTIIGDKDSVVIIPNEVKCIDRYAFLHCTNLKEIIIPSSVEIIESRAFIGCSNLKKIQFESEYDEIGNGSKYNITKIKDRAFYGCSSLESVELPDSIKEVGARAFKDCISLKKIKLSNNMSYITDCTFEGCHNLESVILPKDLSGIWSKAFAYCNSLKNIVLPPGVFSICAESFSNCKSLEKIVMPDSIEKLGSGAFFNCENLKEIVFSNSLKEIEAYCFSGCKGIESIVFPHSVMEIGLNSFSNCDSLKKVVLPNNPNLTVTSAAFKGTRDLEEIVIKNYSHLHKRGIVEILNSFNSYCIDDNEDFVLCKDSISNISYTDIMSLLGCSKNSAMILSVLFSKEEIEKMGQFRFVLPIIADGIVSKENYRELKVNLLNNKEFNRLIKVVSKEYGGCYCSSYKECYFDLFKLAYSMGMFDRDSVVRQKACEYLTNLFENKIFYLKKVHGNFDSLLFNGYNKEWAEFIMNKQNFIKVLELEKEQNGYISRIYNSFDGIKEYGRRNKGRQSYRKVTLDMCIQYLANISFDNVDSYNEDIAKVISFYTREQRTFDMASSIRQEYLRLSSAGIVKSSLLEELNDARETVIEDISSSITNLDEIAQGFTYEFISKYDPRNFVLGKYCSCCAHLEGAGRGIVRASILHPDCQNLVIKDKKGKIVAKSTLYINREKGYGLFNNVEVNDSVSDEDKIIVYEKYMEAIRSFVIRYNELNVDKPITQVNVGMHLNDIDDLIRINNERGELLGGIDFSFYGGHRGDYYKEQYVLWKKDNEKR